MEGHHRTYTGAGQRTVPAKSILSECAPATKTNEVGRSYLAMESINLAPSLDDGLLFLGEIDRHVAGLLSSQRSAVYRGEEVLRYARAKEGKKKHKERLTISTTHCFKRLNFVRPGVSQNFTWRGIEAAPH